MGTSMNNESTFFAGFEYESKWKHAPKKKINVNMETTGNKNAARMEGRWGRLLGQTERLIT